MVTSGEGAGLHIASLSRLLLGTPLRRNMLYPMHMNPKDHISAPAISADERRRRQEAVNFARGNVRLSGFILSPEVEKISQRYIDGELTSEEFIEAIKSRHH